MKELKNSESALSMVIGKIQEGTDYIDVEAGYLEIEYILNLLKQLLNVCNLRQLYIVGKILIELSNNQNLNNKLFDELENFFDSEV